MRTASPCVFPAPFAPLDWAAQGDGSNVFCLFSLCFLYFPQSMRVSAPAFILAEGPRLDFEGEGCEALGVRDTLGRKSSNMTALLLPGLCPEFYIIT